MGEGEVLKCPKCGAEMEGGFLDVLHGGGICEVRFSGEEPSVWRARGDILMDGLGRMTAIAYRCSACKLVLFEYYGEIE